MIVKNELLQARTLVEYGVYLFISVPVSVPEGGPGGEDSDAREALPERPARVHLAPRPQRQARVRTRQHRFSAEKCKLLDNLTPLSAVVVIICK